MDTDWRHVLQCLGTAAVMSINGALIRIIYPQRIFGRGMTINTMMVAVSTAACTTAAAGILSVAGWQWLFAINVPISLFTLWLRHQFLPGNPQKNSGQRFNAASKLMNALTFGLLLSLAFCPVDQSLLDRHRAVSIHHDGRHIRQLSAAPALTSDAGRHAAYPAVFPIHVYIYLLLSAQILAMLSLPFYL